MNGYRGVFLLCCAGLCAGLASTGAGCQWIARPPTQQWLGPAVLPPSATLEQVIAAVNRNSTQIQAFYTNQATLSGPHFPTLRASVAFQRPRSFRLRGDTAFTGPELDLGSNQELFWMWVRRSQPPALYYCRHDQFAHSAARQMIPIEPAWLIEALGIAEFDPALPHQGPYRTANGQLQVRTIRETPEGLTTKITVVDSQRALVLGQFIYDHQGRLRASAVASQHRRDPLSGLVVPRVVDVSCPAAQFTMRIDLGNVTVNQLPADAAVLFSLPSYEGWQLVDLADPNAPLPEMQPVNPRQYLPQRPASSSLRARPVPPGWGRVVR